jgi:hypothetical protein
MLITVMARGSAGHEYQRQQTKHKGLNQADEKLEPEEDNVSQRQEVGHDEKQDHTGEYITQETEGKRDNF